jgi:hypothetical protein
MRRNPLLDLAELGQSVWLDFLSRGMLAPGELLRLIRQDGLNGVTSNPSIPEGPSWDKRLGHGHRHLDSKRSASRQYLHNPRSRRRPTGSGPATSRL